jgi:hypothetical protein
MQDTEVEVLLLGEVRHTRHKGLPERSIIGPFGKDFVDRCVVDGWCALGVCGYGEALPLHACIQEPQNVVEDAMIAQFTLGSLGSALGHREVR